MLQEKNQAGASEPDSLNVFEAALTRPPLDIVLDSLYSGRSDKLEFAGSLG